MTHFDLLDSAQTHCSRGVSSLVLNQTRLFKISTNSDSTFSGLTRHYTLLVIWDFSWLTFEFMAD